MIHFLTIGFLDLQAVKARRVRSLKPLRPEMLALLDEFLDAKGMMEGEAVQVCEGWIRCPWYAPTRNITAERFAIEAAKQGCTVADVEHARLVDVRTLGDASAKHSIRLGDEHDEQLREALRAVILEMGGLAHERLLGLGGSQEVERVHIVVGEQSATIEAETYVGLSMQGDEQLVEAIFERVAMRLARPRSSS
jgi:hypothetical protein